MQGDKMISSAIVSHWSIWDVVSQAAKEPNGASLKEKDNCLFQNTIQMTLFFWAICKYLNYQAKTFWEL